MPARRESHSTPPQRRGRPAATSEEKEQEMIGYAVDAAEKQLRNGTASAQVITHYLKLGTTREQLEQEKLRHENSLLQAKKEAMESAKRVEELYGDALKAMRAYSGQPELEAGIDEEL